jgi:hypothetical protein
MVQRKKTMRYSRRGGSAKIMTFMKKVNDFLRNSKLVSNVGASLHKSGIPYAGKIGSFASSLGYGRRRMGRGGSMRPAGGRMGYGGSLRPAGGMHKCC